MSSSQSKVVHVVDMSLLKQFFMGRGTEADVRITDISVSRLNSSIFKTRKGEYYLCDNDGKFGTLVQIRTPMQIFPGDFLRL